MLESICQVCKLRPASSHLLENRPEGVRELHICLHCIANLGLDLREQPPAIDAVLSAGTEHAHPAAAAVDQDDSLRCPSCGLTFNDFNSGNRFGCADDYQTFGDRLLILLREIHQADRHVGRTPGEGAGEETHRLRRQRRLLHEALKVAVASENYEEAARIRDQITAIEGEMPDHE